MVNGAEAGIRMTGRHAMLATYAIYAMYAMYAMFVTLLVSQPPMSASKNTLFLMASDMLVTAPVHHLVMSPY